MAWYPEVQRKAQAEIDRVVGYSRLPDYSDQDELPYIQAVVKEVLRWHPIVPLSMSLYPQHYAQTTLQVYHTGLRKAISMKDISFLQVR